MEAAWQQILAERRRPRSVGAIEQDLLAWVDSGPDAETRRTRLARLAARAVALAMHERPGAAADIPVAGDEPIPPADE